jgi:uncharacterized membrane protein
MLTPLESGFFDSIAGLPLHPLVVHFAVVLLPLAALGLVVLVAVPRWADRFGWLTLGILAVGVVAAFVAKESGEALAAQVGQPATHAAWGDQLPLLSVGLLVLAGAWFFLHRRSGGAGSPRSLAATVTGLLASVLALVVTGVTVVVGHTGAQAAWGGTMSSQDGQATVAASPSPATPTPATSTGRPTKGPTTSPSTGAGHTMTDVSRHASASSCWTAIDGNVYDLTNWIGRHPGGRQAILGLCGRDGTSAFNAQHGGQGRPEAELRQFLIGPLG